MVHLHLSCKQVEKVSTLAEGIEACRTRAAGIGELARRCGLFNVARSAGSVASQSLLVVMTQSLGLHTGLACWIVSFRTLKTPNPTLIHAMTRT